MKRSVAVLLLVVCTMLWGAAFVAQKSATGHMGALTFPAIRYLIGALLVAPFALREYRRQRAKGIVVTSKQWWQIGWLSLAFFLGVWLQQAALFTATATNGGFLTSLYVIFTPVVTYILVRAKPHPIVYVGAPMALIGIYLLTGANLSSFTTGDLLLICCAVFWAIQVAMLGPLVKDTGLPIFISTINFFATAILAAIGALAFEHPDLAGINGGWIEILYSAVFSTALAFTFQAMGQQYVPPANAAIILSAESLWAALAGALILGERLPLLSYLGAAIIFAAIVLVEAIPAIRARRATAAPGSA